MPALKLVQIGDSTVLTIPPEMLRRMNAQTGDNLIATETSDGYLLTKMDEETSEQLEAGRELMKQYREAFQALAE